MVEEQRALVFSLDKYCTREATQATQHLLHGAEPDSSGHLGFSAAAAAKSLQSCPTLRDHMDCSLPGSSVRGIFQARVLEEGAIAFSKNDMLINP